MRKHFFTLALLVLCSTISKAQFPFDSGLNPANVTLDLPGSEARAGGTVRRRFLRLPPHFQQPLQVKHYDIAVEVNPSSYLLSGTSVMQFVPQTELGQARLRLHQNMVISKVTLDGVNFAGFARQDADLVCTFNPPLVKGAHHDLAITYSGTPGFDTATHGGVVFSTHQGVPVATTTAEPYDAYQWRPLVEDVANKSTASLHITVPSGMVAASNGVLVATTINSNGSMTYHWEEKYPIATYNICFNITNYVAFSQNYTSLDGKTVMPIVNYVYPEDRVIAEKNFARIPQAIRFFAEIAGEYPFLEEKYGQVEVNYPGMEHQTITAIWESWVRGERPYPPGSAELMYVHELAHQWWGNDVTCATWHDVWLNEGFGTYFEALWFGHDVGKDEGTVFAEYYNSPGGSADTMAGSVWAADEGDPFADSGAVYYKGAWVLHMLKKVMGEGKFYDALRAYRQIYHYDSATTADFQSVCESFYGDSLKWFFDQWVYTPSRVSYKVAYSSSGDNVNVTIKQVQTQLIANRTEGNNDVYIMPVDVTLYFADGTTQKQTVWNDQRSQTFAFTSAKKPIRVFIDEESWILKFVSYS